MYAVGEVFDGDMGYLNGYIGPLPAVLNYPFYFYMKTLFTGGSNMY